MMIDMSSYTRNKHRNCFSKMKVKELVNSYSSFSLQINKNILYRTIIYQKQVIVLIMIVMINKIKRMTLHKIIIYFLIIKQVNRLYLIIQHLNKTRYLKTVMK